MKKGFRHTKKSIALMSKNQIGRIPWNKGKTGVYSKEVIEKQRQSHLGEKHPNWKGGISYNFKYPDAWNKELRKSIRERDNYECQKCGHIQSNLDRSELCVHHIDFNKYNCEPINLISLCISCHRKSHKITKD